MIIREYKTTSTVSDSGRQSGTSRPGAPCWRPTIAAWAPIEPDWVRDVFPDQVGHVAQQSRVARLRRDAKKEWQRIVASLDPQGLLASVDESVLLDHCTAVAVARECYRDIALNGYSNRTERGVAKNPATTVLAQQRDRLKYAVAQLGASPLARDALNPRRSLDDEDSPFD